MAVTRGERVVDVAQSQAIWRHQTPRPRTHTHTHTQMGEEGTTSSPSPRRNDHDDDDDDVQTTRVSPRRRPSIVARRGSRVEDIKDQEERGKVVVMHR